jgi:hypothetical protein
LPFKRFIKERERIEESFHARAQPFRRLFARVPTLRGQSEALQEFGVHVDDDRVAITP